MNIRKTLSRFEDALKRVQSLPAALGDTVRENSNVLLNLNRDQMLLGTNTEGKPFTPSYLNDPYFKTQEQANAYASMKLSLEHLHRERITYPLNYHKDRFTPNLIVTGPFQDSMFITTNARSFEIGSRYIDSSDIEAKYNYKVFGLAPLSVEYFWRYFLLQNLRKHLKYFG